MVSATIFEAKTNLSDLLKQVQQGETVIITSGRDKIPIARLVAIEPTRPQRLGILETPGFKLPNDFFEPLPEEELRLWEGEAE